MKLKSLTAADASVDPQARKLEHGSVMSNPVDPDMIPCSEDGCEMPRERVATSKKQKRQGQGWIA